MGKTSLVRKYVEKAFAENYLPTIGANVMEKDITSTNQGITTEIKMTIWDIAAQENFKRMRPAFFHGAQGAFLVADLSRAETFDEILEWDKELTAILPNIPKIFLANKSDLKPSINDEKLAEIGKKLKAIKVLKTSALNGENVPNAFRTMTKELMEKVPEITDSDLAKKEAKWRSTIQYLYVIDLSGLLLYEEDLHQASDDIGKTKNGAILSGALVAISGLLREITQNTNPLKVISQEGFCILIEEGHHSLVALIATEELKTTRQKMQEFVKEFERKFGTKVRDSIDRGDLKPAGKIAAPIVKKIFNPT